MNILATYTDTNQRTYNIVDTLQDGDLLKYNHVYTAIQLAGETENLGPSDATTECHALDCTICVYNGEPCSSFNDILSNSRFDEFFPNFRQSHPELFI